MAPMQPVSRPVFPARVGSMDVSITVCSTCKFAEGEAFGPDGRSGGTLLAEALETAARNRADAPRIVRHECLWACAHSCAILIGSPGRTGYLAGRFVPGAEAATAILDWTEAYAASEDGSVRYRLWPDGMRGHFIARIPGAAEGTQWAAGMSWFWAGRGRERPALPSGWRWVPASRRLIWRRPKRSTAKCSSGSSRIAASAPVASRPSRSRWR